MVILQKSGMYDNSIENVNDKWFLGGYTDEEREPLVILFERAEGRAQ